MAWNENYEPKKVILSVGRVSSNKLFTVKNMGKSKRVFDHSSNDRRAFETLFTFARVFFTMKKIIMQKYWEVRWQNSMFRTFARISVFFSQVSKTLYSLDEVAGNCWGQNTGKVSEMDFHPDQGKSENRENHQ